MPFETLSARKHESDAVCTRRCLRDRRLNRRRPRSRPQPSAAASRPLRESLISNFSASTCARRKRTDATHGDSRGCKCTPIVRRLQPQAQAQRRPLMHLKFHIAGAVIWLRAWNRNFRENLAGQKIVGVCARDELVDGHFPRAVPRSPGSPCLPEPGATWPDRNAARQNKDCRPSVPVARTRTFATWDSNSAKAG